jgi:hypothetical protein
MAKKKAKVDVDDEDGIVISGFGILTISVKLELHQDESYYPVPTVLQHRVKTVIPDPGVGRSMNRDRFMSAGQVFGHELGRIANHFREGLADPGEMAIGFSREMQDWDKDHATGGE